MECLCQLGTGLKTEASQCVRLAGGQPWIKCPMALEKSGRHHTGGGRGPTTAGAGGSCVSNTSALGREISTDSEVWPGAGLFEGKAVGTCRCLPPQCARMLSLEVKLLLIGVCHLTLPVVLLQEEPSLELLLHLLVNPGNQILLACLLDQWIDWSGEGLLPPPERFLLTFNARTSFVYPEELVSIAHLPTRAIDHIIFPFCLVY